MSPSIDISVVVPVFDEEQNLPLLHEELARALGSTGVPWEVLYVDDRSRDLSFAAMLRLRAADEHVRVIRFRRRSGQTAAMQAGFDHARGRVIVTIDGDLQNDPADIPRLVAKLNEGYDVVAGWRKQRYDGFVLRRMPSRIANRLIQLVTGVPIHDTGCTLKAFRRELLERMPIYAEQHRFLPAISAATGARITEVVTNHRPRLYGRSKYGLGRAMRVLLDLLVVRMLATSSQRPLSFFVLLTLPLFGVCALAGIQLVASFGDARLDSNWGALLKLSFMLLFMTCLFFFLLGLLAELAVKASGMHRPRSLRVLVKPHDAEGSHGRAAR